MPILDIWDKIVPTCYRQFFEIDISVLMTLLHNNSSCVMIDTIRITFYNHDKLFLERLHDDRSFLPG